MKGRQTFFIGTPDSAWPTVIAIVGPNGSGKSSIARLLGLTNARVGDQRYQGRLVVDEATGEIVLPLVNADEIAKHIHNSRPDLGWYDCNVEAAREAARMSVYSESVRLRHRPRSIAAPITAGFSTALDF